MTSSTNSPDVEQVASDWIAFAKEGPNGDGEIVARGWVLYDLVEDDAVFAWKVMLAVLARYTEDDFLTDGTEAQCAVGNMAAGPLEDLLDRHGPQFIEIIEAEARRDRRMAWALRGVWRTGMSDDVWERVQRAAGGPSR